MLTLCPVRHVPRAAGAARGARQPCVAAARRAAPRRVRCTGGDDAAPGDDAFAGDSDAGRDDASGEPPSTSGDAALQEMLVDMLRFETAKQAIAQEVTDYVEGEQANLRAIVEQGKEELDALEEASRQRSALEFGAAMADINAIADEFEAGLRADRAAAERAVEDLAEFEAQASRDMNAYLPFQGLYQPTVTAKKKAKKPLTPDQAAAADAEASAVASAARASLGPAARGGAYAAAAGAVIALGFAAATGPDGLTPGQLGIAALTVSALGFQVWLQAQGGLGGGGDDDKR